MEEIFKDIPGYEGLYQVSNLGNVKSIPREQRCTNGYRITKEKILKQSIDGGGYFNISIYKDGIAKTIKVHQLVAIAFLNHMPCGHKLVIDHINDDKLDNRVENLQIVTQRFNCKKTQSKYSSKYKGVSWYKPTQKWVSNIRIRGKLFNLGYFKCELAAHLAYQNKLKEII
jgi:hypothetical protein